VARKVIDELVGLDMAHVLRMLGADLVIKLSRLDPTDTAALEKWPRYATHGDRATLVAYEALESTQSPTITLQFKLIVLAARRVAAESGRRPSRRNIARYLRP
jgi:hypothetical protein